MSHVTLRAVWVNAMWNTHCGDMVQSAMGLRSDMYGACVWAV